MARCSESPLFMHSLFGREREGAPTPEEMGLKPESGTQEGGDFGLGPEATPKRTAITREVERYLGESFTGGDHAGRKGYDAYYRAERAGDYKAVFERDPWEKMNEEQPVLQQSRDETRERIIDTLKNATQSNLDAKSFGDAGLKAAALKRLTGETYEAVRGGSDQHDVRDALDKGIREAFSQGDDTSAAEHLARYAELFGGNPLADEEVDRLEEGLRARLSEGPEAKRFGTGGHFERQDALDIMRFAATLKTLENIPRWNPKKK